jgi:hypothetical protein
MVAVRVSERSFQVRVSYLLQQEISRHPLGLEHGGAAVTKCVQGASRLQPQRLEDQLQLAPHVMPGVWLPAGGLKHSSRSFSFEIRTERRNESGLDKHSSLPVAKTTAQRCSEKAAVYVGGYKPARLVHIPRRQIFVIRVPRPVTTRQSGHLVRHRIDTLGCPKKPQGVRPLWPTLWGIP